MKKLLLLVAVLGAIGYGLYTHWDKALELNRAFRSRPYRNLSDEEILQQNRAVQERVLSLYQEKEAYRQKGLKDDKGLFQAEDIDGAIATGRQMLAELDHELSLRRVFHRVFHAAELALLVGLPALIFISLLARVIRRRSPVKFEAPAPDREPLPGGWHPFRKKAVPGPISPIRIGATQAEILGRLGPPLQRTHFTETEAWSYRIPVPAPSPDGGLNFTKYRSLIVLFRDQKVFDLSFEDAGPDFDSIHID
jgi:hypothetical protein